MASSTISPTPPRIANRALDQRTAEAMQARFDRAALSARRPAELRPAAVSQRALGEHLPLSPQRLCVRPDERRAGRHPGLPDQHPQGRQRSRRARLYQPHLTQSGALHRPGGRRSRSSARSWACCRRAGCSRRSSSSRRTSISGAPFDHGPDNDLFADFKAKVGKLAIAAGDQGRADRRGARAR